MIKDRPGYEIDARARHTETAVGAGLEVRVTGKTHVDIAGRHTTYRFAGDQVFEGTSLDQILNRKGTFGSATIRYSATPLTTLTLLGEVSQDRFDGSPVRDNNSFRIMLGVEFDPFAFAWVGMSRRVDTISGWHYRQVLDAGNGAASPVDRRPVIRWWHRPPFEPGDKDWRKHRLLPPPVLLDRYGYLGILEVAIRKPLTEFTLEVAQRPVHLP